MSLIQLAAQQSWCFFVTDIDNRHGLTIFFSNF